jgi:hypothetical protein
VFTASTGRRSGGLTGIVEGATTRLIGDSDAWEEMTVRDMLSTVNALDGIQAEYVEGTKEL